MQSWLVGLLFVSELVALSGCSQRRLEVVEQQQVRHVSEVLHLAYPVRVIECDTYRDGGTLGVKVIDKWGRRFSFAVDGRMRSAEVRRDLRGDSAFIAARHIYVGAAHPNKKGAREIPVLGDEELAILDMLDLASADILTPERRDSLVAIVLEKGSDGPSVYKRMLDALDEKRKTALRLAMLAGTRRRSSPAGTMIPIR